MTEVAQQTLHLVSKELGLTLGDARQSLEAFAERPDDAALLNACAERLHEVHGVLRLVEVYGAALLAEEMEQVARYLLESGDDRRNHPEGLDALMRSMVQLPAYLERVLGGGRDLALVLLPLLNDLRAVRGQALLSEGTLLLLNLTSDRQPQPVPPQPGEPPLTVAQWARRLRPRFQVGLLGWIKNERPTQHLEILSAVSERLEQVATRQPVFQLWWVTGAVIEALREGGLDGNATLKRLLGQADRELKRLYESGEPRYAETPPLDLLNNLLYYVARASCTGPRVSAVRASFKLQELLPVSEQVEQERENLSAPSVKLMQTVAAAIKEDLSRVKDVLDIFVRKGGAQVEELDTQLEMLRKIADTLGVLGLGGLRQKVQAQIARLHDIVARKAEPSDTVLVDIAATLISVEDNLDAQLVRLIMPTEGMAPVGEEDAEFRQVQDAVLRECIVNLARVKEAIGAIVGRHEMTGADQVPGLMRGITAGLLMLGRSRAVEIMEAIGRHVEDVTRPNAPLLQGRLDRLADAIVSIEYYMETLQSGRSDPWYMLDNADACLHALEAESESPAVPDVALPASVPLAADPYARTQKIDFPTGVRPGPVEHDTGPTGTEVLTFTGTATDASVQAVVPTPVGPALDPDLVALFVEEAREEIEKIDQHFPAWDENPLDQESLVRVRRSFHTLKGSGRMVGARSVGEFAWAIETLLNRVLSGTLARSPQMLEVMRESMAALPQLIDELEHGTPPTANVGLLIGRAQALSEGRDPALAQAVALAPMAPLAPRPEPATALPAPGPAWSPGGEDSLIATEILMSNDPALPKPVPPKAAAPKPAPAPEPAAVAAPPKPAPRPAATPALLPGQPLEPPSRFIRVTDEPKPSAESRRDVVPPPPPSGSEFVMVAPDGPTPEGADPVLIDIYRKEVASHVANVRQWLKECEGRFAPYAVTEGLHRSCHTLAGASKMADATAGVRIAEPLNLYVRKLFDHGLGLPEAGKRMLADALAAMDDVVAHIEETAEYFPGHADILARLAWLDTDADREIAARGLQPKDASEQSGPLPPPDADLIEIDSMMEDAVVEPPPAVAATPPPVVAPPAREPAPTDTDHYDSEIAVIFSEEATELLELADASLSAYRADTKDADRVTELKRVLHTLKGGARMAGVTAMGDLAHEVESLLIQTEAGARTAEPRTLEVLQASLDELHRMRETVGAGRPVAAARDLVTRIRALARGLEAPPVLKTVAPEQPLPAPVAAPPEASLPPALPPPVVKDIAASGRVAALDADAAEVPAPRDEPAPSYSDAEVPILEATSVSVHFSTDTLAGATAGVAGAAADVAKPADEAVEQASLEQSRSFVLPPGREPQAPAERQELARVDAELLDSLLNNAGEVSIFRARLEQQLSSVEFNLVELARVVQRLKEQMRNLEIETEAQILHRHSDGRSRSDFDPLELDQYSAIQQYSRALAESAADVASVQGLLESLTREAQNLLMQQARVVTDLQNGLMRTRMVPFSRHTQRLTRIVRQVAAETGKKCELVVHGAGGELDRQVLERMLPPFEHMLRNSVVHGIETPAERVARDKPDTGRIEVALKREGSEVVIVVQDDGAGVNLRAIRDKAQALGMIDPKKPPSDEEALQLILEPGFSTATSVTQAAGRGVGMDVVATEIKKLGGALHMETVAGKGTKFTIRLPFTLAISQALIVRIADEMYALPLPTVEGVVRLTRTEVQKHLVEDQPTFEYGGQRYRFQHLGAFVGGPTSTLPEQDVPVPIVLVRAGESSTALVTDELVGSREIVVKSVGPQIAGIRGIAGATILGDGRIVIILDMGSLVRADWRARPVADTRERGDRRTFALVVDDSITVRRVTQRLLERNGMRVLTAKDGVDAMQIMQEHVPDVILLDIEMPRMDGYEVAAAVRGDARLSGVPIVMITSRVGEKHRARAIELGVDDYLGKPYQENQLLDAIEPLVNRRRVTEAM